MSEMKLLMENWRRYSQEDEALLEEGLKEKLLGALMFVMLGTSAPGTAHAERALEVSNDTFEEVLGDLGPGSWATRQLRAAAKDGLIKISEFDTILDTEGISVGNGKDLLVKFEKLKAHPDTKVVDTDDIETAPGPLKMRGKANLDNEAVLKYISDKIEANMDLEPQEQKLWDFHQQAQQK